MSSKHLVTRALECTRALLDAGVLAVSQSLSALRSGKRTGEEKRRKQKLKQQK